MKSLNIKLPGSPENADPVTIPVDKSGGIGTLNLHDLVKGLLIAGIAGAWIVIYQSLGIWINGDVFNIIWQDVARAGVSGVLGYLSVNLLSPAKIIIKAKELIK